jgi:uncharacterized membrane protein SpoIIM required for sporulation
MREIAFIKQNKEKWLEFEQAISGKEKKNPDDLASLYIQLINDLAFAQTYYPKSKAVVYLNNLAVQTYQMIYKTRRHEKNRLIQFFKTDVPLTVYNNRRYVLYAFVLFFFFLFVGVFSATQESDFLRFVIGDDYVDMTLENIEKGNPVAVYKMGSSWGSAIGITLNNLNVGAKEFILGITGGLGTAYVLFKNTMMLGAFQYFFYEHNVFWASVRGIWIHGAMEIFGMVIEAAAGFVIGAGILFPKTFSRVESLKRGFKNGLIIWFSTIPFTIAAGMLEGFITRYSPDMPIALNIFIILFTLGVISWYYLIYPYRVHKRMMQEIQAS